MGHLRLCRERGSRIVAALASVTLLALPGISAKAQEPVGGEPSAAEPGPPERRPGASDAARTSESSAADRKVRIYRTIGPDGTARYTMSPEAETEGKSEEPAASPSGDRSRPAVGAPATPPDASTAGQIELLREQIRKDREVLRRIISQPGFTGEAFSKDPVLREIADRLPRLQAELAALEAERP